MRRKRYTPGQIIGMLREAEVGLPTGCVRNHDALSKNRTGSNGFKSKNLLKTG